MSQFTTNLFRLPGGRVLEWLECGDPKGYPILFFHGYIGSIRQAHIADAIARQEGLRIIAVNRPGVGRSSVHLYSSMADHACEVLQLTQSLGIDEYATCGFSAGAGYAIACAAMAPHATKFITICSPLGPLAYPVFRRQLSFFRWMTFALARHMPVIAIALARGIRTAVLRYPVYTLALLNAAKADSTDPLVAENPAVQHAIADGMIDAITHKQSGTYLIHDLALSYTWGFDPTTIRQPVTIWHGRNDAITTLRSAQVLSEMMPNVRTEFRDSNHVLILSLLPEIMRSIAQRIREMPLMSPVISADAGTASANNLLLPRLQFQR